MYNVYILYNKAIDKYYVGHTSNLKQRLKDHRRGKTKRHYTKNQKGQWELVYTEKYSNKKTANQREKEIKLKKSRKYIEHLIKGTRLKCARSSIG